MITNDILRIGDISDNGQVTIIDEDRLCYIVKSESRGSIGLRTISKALLNEYVQFFLQHPNANANLAREELCGKTDIDRFEYGYTSTLSTMAKMVLSLANSKIANERKTKGEKKLAIQQIIYYGAPGTGKSHAIKKLTEGKRVIRTTFHPDSDYSTFVGAYKPTTIEMPMRDVTGKVIVENEQPVTENRIIYEFVEQAFLQAYTKAWKQYASATAEGKKPEEVYLVIEEINRGNCAQIFGDLFQLLDRGDNGFSEYPINADKDLQKQLAKSFADMAFLNAPAMCGMSAEKVALKVRNGEIMLLPSNLFIWATMNTSDQSLFPIDSAFKRRWEWRYVRIDDVGKGWKIQAKGKKYDWWDFLENINTIIGDTTRSEDKKLGYFFCKTTDGIISAETFVSKVVFYLWNDVFKDYEFEGDVFVDEDKTTKLSFDKFYISDAAGQTIVNEAKVAVFLTNLGVKFELSDEGKDNVNSDNEGEN